MFQTQSRYRFCYAPRFISVDWTWLALRHRAKPATARADITQQHECRSSMIPALPDVGALRRFANRMQTQAAGQLFQIMEVFPDWSLGFEPRRFGLPDRRSQLDLHKL